MPQKRDKYKIPLLLFFVIAMIGLILLPFFRYGITPDATSYISIAEKYSHADLRNAINGYWGPLLSWIIAPAFWLNIDPMLFGRVVLIFSAALISVLTYVILKISATKTLAFFGAIISGFLSLSWALAGPLTPDLLFALILTLMVAFGINIFNKPSIKDSAVFGLLGSFLYFAKPVGFFIFFGIWLIIFIYRFIEVKKLNKILKQLAPTILFFIVITMPYILLLSIKYEKPTITSSSSYNLAVIGPNSTGHPINNQIVPPPNPSAISAWEDISYFQMQPWSPFGSYENFKFFINNIGENIGETISVLWQYSLPLIIFAIYGFFINSKSKVLPLQKVLVGGLVATLLLIYLPTVLEPRYLIFIGIAAVIAFFWSFNYFNKSSQHKYFIWAVFALSVSMFMYWRVDYLNAQVDSGKVVRSDSEVLKNYIDGDDRIVGDKVSSIYACYYTKAKCYGSLSLSKNYLEDIKTYQINYLLITDSACQYLSNLGLQLEPVENARYLDQKLYKVIH